MQGKQILTEQKTQFMGQDHPIGALDLAILDVERSIPLQGSLLTRMTSVAFSISKKSSDVRFLFA
jgi:hypothetical protein